MMNKKPLALSIALLNLSMFAVAEQTEPEAMAIEEVQVLGSYISSSNTAAANPVSVLTADEMQYTGASDVTDMLNVLSVNSGAENRPDTFTSFYSQGTSNVNLRGLGLSSTLVLINGSRQTISGAKAQDGSTFVDTASIPAIAIQRLEVLKEGAAAAYGSDAVAGVVNFITKDDFEGFKIDGSWQSTAADSQTDKNLSFLAGFGNDDTHVVVAASALRRSNLNGRERPELIGAAVSSLGTSFVMSEDVTVGSGDWAGTYASGDNDERNVALALLQKQQGFRPVELRQIVIRQNDVPLAALDGFSKFWCGLYSFAVDFVSAILQEAHQHFGIQRRIFDD